MSQHTPKQQQQRLHINIVTKRSIALLKWEELALLTPDSAQYSYPSNSRIPIFFRVAKRGQVIRRNLTGCVFQIPTL